MSGDFVPPRGSSFFFPPRNWTWEWHEHRRVITWKDQGPTIAFHSEIDAIFTHLAPQGLPPLGSLVLLLAACRDGWEDAPAANVLEELLARLDGTPRDRGDVAHLLRGLSTIRALPDDLRRSLPARAELAAIVFETAQECTTPEEAMSLLEDWRRWQAAELENTPWTPRLGLFRHELHALLGGLSKVDERTLRLRLATGLETLPAPAEVQLSDSQGTRGLLESMLDDPELCGVAAVAKHLLAVVSLPRFLTAANELPEGGVSDISNRGPLDRLLISELAHDETTLAARLALNEALYYRRETPPGPPVRCRVLLLDSGVRMWGMPRVFAAAVALALSADSRRRLKTAAFRASGPHLQCVDLGTRDGVAAHLAALETDAHPGAALVEFESRLAESDSAAEAVVITCEEALADAGFQQRLANCQVETLYVASVSRAGQFRLFARSRRGQRDLQQATLDVDRLLASQPRRPPLLDAGHVELPAIFGVSPFPLLLSTASELQRSWHVEQVGALTYSSDGRLLLWDEPGFGARQIAEGLPGGALLACENSAPLDRTLAVVGKLGPNGLHALQIDCRQRSVRSTRLDFPSIPEPPIVIHQGRVLVRYRGNVVEFDPLSGEMLSQCTLPPGGRPFGRLIQRMPELGAVAIGAGPASYERLSEDLAPQLMLAVFETAGIDGQTVVTSDGQLICGADRKQVRVTLHLKPPLTVLGVSRDGRRFAIAGKSIHDQLRKVLVEVPSGKATQYACGDYQMLEADLMRFVRPKTLRWKFGGIGLSPLRQLVLAGHRRRLAWAIDLHPGNGALQLTQLPKDVVPASYVPFGEGNADRGYSLASARLKDGTLAWRDSRGLLHLRSSDRSLPEVTFVITERWLAGWISDGRVFGPSYFHHQEPTPGTVVYQDVLEPLIAVGCR